MAGPGSGRPAGGEGYCDVIYSPYPQSSPFAPRLTDLFQQFGLDKIRDIMNRPDGKTFEQRIIHLREELDAFERARNIFYMVEVDDDEDEDEDEDEEDENVGQMLLGDEENPDTAKRPHAPIEGELECEKPKMAQDLRCRL
ncbi:hypothetical protein CFC21_069878 [Triticum aestivum]|uniref:Uncharacterized protein n=2 Tax=Triticum aestivum TaxID=4565 RepID=A0A3B6LGB9_WHEAT|nr:uncharacterized protein LOC123115606 isoform X1 [Triticum aestivum]KAF7063353.1 hypothetical protein CFC21_069878 [Triticum aestivum]